MNSNRGRGIKVKKRIVSVAVVVLLVATLPKSLDETLEPILLGIISKGSEFNFKTGCNS